ncbi:MAG: sugar ABC transporter ATP-binding protein [Solirubrobacterales bacterium]|nr:sugar ABC transporter ATP-binding protein [Solirubrobacterales bacterium]
MSEPEQPAGHEPPEAAGGQSRDSALEGIDIRKSYGGVVALDDATFRASPGEVHALVGENGAGKSTMIKALAGVIRPDEGQIRIRGEDVRLRSPEHALRRGVATVFQELTLLPRMTVAENLLIGREPRGHGRIIRRLEMPDVAAELLAEHGVESVDAGELVENLALAQQQLVEIVGAVMREPSVLILDEPTSALARREVEWLFGLVRRLRDQGTCVVFTSHRWSEVTDLADRVTVFRNGTDVGTQEQISEEEAVRLMTGRQVSTAYVEPEEEPEREVVLEARELSASGLHGVSLSLHAGEVLGIGGLEGQGQRELFHALYGLAPADGEIEIRGERKRLHNPREAIAAGIAFIPQDRKAEGLLLPMSVRDNLTLPILRRVAASGVLRPAAERGAAREMIDRLHIDARRPGQPVGTLSGGNQQKVLLGRWLLADSHILLLYDVTRGVDVATKQDIYSLILDLAREGRAILFYSSDTEEIAHLCHRVLVLREGAIAQELQGEISSEEIIGASFREETHA